MYILDTDILSLLQEDDGGASRILDDRMEAVADDELVCVTIISFEEQVRGWMDWIAKAKTVEVQVIRYRRLRHFLEDYADRILLDFDEHAAEIFASLKTNRTRIGTMDLKIAAIALSQGATLVSRNLRDFQKVPDLVVEDWTR